LDTIAAAGVRFDSAISPAPLTLPAHTSLMTALDPPAHGVRHNSTFRLGSGIPTLAERLQEDGFATAAVVGAMVLDSRFGLARGFDVYDDVISSRMSATVGFAERSADTVVDRALAWLEDAPDRFFLWIHLYDPHADYAPPPGFASAFASRPYDGEIAFVDAQLGRFLEALGTRWPDASTLLVVTSDHGESLGEHGESTHAYTIHGATQRIPLLIRGPGIPRGQVIAEPVGLIDVAPTVLALVGAQPLPAATGRDLTPRFHGRDSGGDPGPGPGDRAIYAETLATHLDHGWSPLWGLRTSRYQYIRAPRKELYDLRADPAESRNVALRHPDLTARFEALLAERAAIPPLTDARLASPLGGADRERLRSLGYVVPEGNTVAQDPPINPEGPDPKDEIGVLRLLGEAQQDVHAGRLERALARLASVEGGGTAVPALRAAILVATDEYERAEADARFVLDSQPNRPDLWIILGRALAGQNRLEDARTAFEMATRLDPRSLTAHIFLGRVSQELGQSTAAIAALERAREIDPTAVEPGWQLAVLYFAQGSTEQAEAILRGYEQNGSDFDPGATARIVLAEARAGGLHTAEERLSRALAKHPDDPDLARVLAALRSYRARAGNSGGLPPPRPASE
jgi:arylsulfatase A-like enzyme/Flp pilus assembly protein TadD